MASYRELTDVLGAVLRRARVGPLDPNATLLQQAQRLYDEARAGKTTESPWTPFQPASPVSLGPSAIAALARQAGIPAEETLARLNDETRSLRLWVNSRYQVAKRDLGDGTCHLSIKRLDQAQIRSWRDLQRIKDELVGPECEAVELYPAQSRLVDSANQHHLWCLTDPAEWFPLGFQERLVAEDIGCGEGQAPLGES